MNSRRLRYNCSGVISDDGISVDLLISIAALSAAVEGDTVRTPARREGSCIR
jgi:hypothetical protein